MDKDKLQHRMRFMPTGMKVREAREGEDESRVIEGCAIVFNQETTLWDGKYEREREIIAPSCVTAEFLKEQDIKLNLLHDRNSSVARCNKGEGTLVLDIREDGLYFSAEMPKCDLGDRALELVKNGTYSGCSFEFRSKDYTIVETKMPDGREDYMITHTAFESITALTIAMDPAYEQTSVGCREAYREQHPELADEEAKREAEEKAKAEKLTRERNLRELQSDFDFEDALENRNNNY